MTQNWPNDDQRIDREWQYAEGMAPDYRCRSLMSAYIYRHLITPRDSLTLPPPEIRLLPPEGVGIFNLTERSDPPNVVWVWVVCLGTCG